MCKFLYKKPREELNDYCKQSETKILPVLQNKNNSSVTLFFQQLIKEVSKAKGKILNNSVNLSISYLEKCQKLKRKH